MRGVSLPRYFCCLIASKFAPEDVIAWCQDEWRAATLERAIGAVSVLEWCTSTKENKCELVILEGFALPAAA